MIQCLYIAGIDFMVNLDARAVVIHGITGADKTQFGECGIEARQVRRRIAELTMADLAAGAAAFIEATSVDAATIRRGLEAYNREMSMGTNICGCKLETLSTTSISPCQIGDPSGKFLWVDWRDPQYGGVGNDNNDGLTIDTPLATVGEAMRRLGSAEGL